MEWVDFDAELKRRNDAGDWANAYTLCEVHLAFPDLKLFRDHWGGIRFCSAEANTDTDHVEIDSCHACDGQPLKAWFYAVLDARGTKIYSNPPCFVVADQNPNGFGEVPRAQWDEPLLKSGIPRFAITKVKQHLDRHPPISYLEADDGEQGGTEGSR